MRPAAVEKKEAQNEKREFNKGHSNFFYRAELLTNYSRTGDGLLTHKPQ